MPHALRVVASSLVAALLLSACSRSRPPQHVRMEAVSYEAELCRRVTVSSESPYHQALPGAESDPALAAELQKLPPPVRRSVLAAGLEPLLARLLRAQSAAAPLSLELLAMRQDLATWLASLSAQLSAITFEADCTGDQISTLLLTLERGERDRTFALTLASLVGAAAFATASAAWQVHSPNSRGPAAVALVGGTASTALAVTALVPVHHRIPVRHVHNLLAPVQQGADPAHFYPLFVFRLLTLPMPSGEPTPREALMARWQHLIAEVSPEERRSDLEQLLFGPGGQYDDESLDLRERLYDELESTLNAQARDLELMNRMLVRMLNRAAATPPS